ncbi:MAG: Ig-like domain-containing protein [Anaeromyxobacteraceae bacterium]
MSAPVRNALALFAAIAAALAPAPAAAALLDRGPADPLLLFPRWYRDLNGTAVGLCKSQVASPNPAAGVGPMCFALAPDPAGFPGNLGPELFYNDLTVAIGTGAAAGGTSTFALRYVAALEATYLPGPTPAHRQEAVFARVRIVMNVQVPGTYTVTHPFGSEVFPDVQATGAHAVFFTVDVPLGPAGDFAAALSGPIGPFIQWDVVRPGESLTVGAEQFLGDPNYLHTFTGSPFGTNYVRVDGPPGSNLDGAGNDFAVQTLGTVLGQRWTAPIPTAFAIEKAAYARSATASSVDVWASSAPGQKLVLTGAAMPSLQLAETTPGHYYGHVEYPSAASPPASVTVTDLTSLPVAGRSARLADHVEGSATYASASGAIDVVATTSDATAPALAVAEPFGGAMTPGPTPGTATFHAVLPVGAEPPHTVHVRSAAGGSAALDVLVTAGAPMNGAGLPVATSDLGVAVSGAGPTAIPVLANDAYAGAPTLLVLSQPATGSVVAAADGSAIYTPDPGANGPDAFTYAIEDALGISNVATVTFTVPFIARAPTAVADGFAMLQGTTRALPVLANDVAGPGTSIDAASVQAIPGATGVAAASADGTVAFTAPPARGVLRFGYTVANTAGVRSAPATVTVVAFAAPEVVTLRRAFYTASKGKWNVDGFTSWASPALAQLTVRCWLGSAAAPDAATLIGTAPIEATGSFTVVPPAPGPRPAPGQTVTCQTSSGGFAQLGVRVQ